MGTLQDQTRLVLEAQLGYWLVGNDNDSGRRIRGPAPFIELHYNTTTANADVVQSGGFFIGDLAGRTDELNLSAGIITQVTDNFFVSVGAGTPLCGQDDRVFDYLVDVRANWFSGRTARDMSPAYRAGTFQ